MFGACTLCCIKQYSRKRINTDAIRKCQYFNARNIHIYNRSNTFTPPGWGNSENYNRFARAFCEIAQASGGVLACPPKLPDAVK
jgi:hypothetical protein